MEREVTCVICYSKISQDDVVLVCNKCGNLGHENHLRTWLNEKKICPVCNTPYKYDLFKKIEKEGYFYSYQLITQIQKGYHEVFSKFSFKYKFYDFQVSVLNDLLNKSKDCDNLVLDMPPGSGKTLIGLHYASTLQVKTLILVPNLAVMGSWFDRALMFFEEGTKIKDLKQVMGKDSGILHPLTILTYQKLDSELKKYKRKDIQRKKKEQKTFSSEEKSAEKSIRKEPELFINRLIQHEPGLLILDEAHKLSDKWGKMINELHKILNGVKVLGLTATPPQKSEKRSFNFFESEIVIDLPPLVREGIIAPYQDLIYAIPRYTLKAKISKRKSISKTKVTKYKRSGLSIRNFLFQKGLSILKWEDDKLFIKYNPIFLYYAMEVMSFEFKSMGEKLRMLMIFDNEVNSLNKGFNATHDAFFACAHDEVLNKLNPILMTANTLLVSNNFIQEFSKLHTHWCNEKDLKITFNKINHNGFVEIKHRGSDSSTETISRFVTFLLETGNSKLLIGTRHLLGEGWDCINLNTIIDMTFHTEGTTVNQLKGRAFRMPTKLDGKVANIWEFLIEPVNSKKLWKFFKKFEKRHMNYFGIDSKGEIRSGIHRIHPKLLPEKLSYKKKDKINLYWKKEEVARIVTKNSLKRAENRILGRKLWKVGVKIGELQTVIRLSPNLPVVRNIETNYSPLERKIIPIIKQVFDLPEWNATSYITEIANIFKSYIVELSKYLNEAEKWDYDIHEILNNYPKLIFTIPISERFEKLDEIDNIVTDTKSTYYLHISFLDFSEELEFIYYSLINKSEKSRLTNWALNLIETQLNKRIMTNGKPKSFTFNKFPNELYLPIPNNFKFGDNYLEMWEYYRSFGTIIDVVDYNLNSSHFSFTVETRYKP